MRFLIVFLVGVICLIVAQPAAQADATASGAHRVVEGYVVIDGEALNDVTANASTLAAGAPAVYSNTIALTNTKAHSISFKWTAADPAAEIVIEVEHRTRWGDWVSFNPPVRFTLSGASGAETRALLLPVAQEIRIKQNSDSTHETTLRACVVSRF